MANPYTPEAMRARLTEIQLACAGIEKELAPLHEEYDRLRNGPVRDEKRRAQVVALIQKAEAPMREMRREAAMLAKALGGRRLMAKPPR